MRRFFVGSDGIVDGYIYISGRDARHIVKVLRLSVGDRIVAVDGVGVEHTAVIVEASDTRVKAQIETAAQTAAGFEPRVPITLVQAVPKGDKMDFIVQKCTELGVARIVPVITDRVVVKPDGDGLVRKTARWRRIAEESSKQCGRGIVPPVESICSLDAALAALRESGSLVLMPWELERETTLKDVLRRSDLSALSGIGVVIGPEGGFSIDEARHAVAHGAVHVTLGKRILRTETAGMAAAAIILYEMGELGC